MSESYWLHSVSIVVTAEFHNPSILQLRSDEEHPA